MSHRELEKAKTSASNLPQKIPVVRYRVLAAAFAIIAVLGLLIGYLGNYVSLFAHSGAILDPNLNHALTDGIWLKGSLFGYVASVLKFYLFDGGFVKSYATFEILNLAIALLLVLAVLSSIVFFIVSLCTKSATPRNLAVASGILVAHAYAFPLVLGMLTAPTFNVEGAALGYEFSGFTLYFDLPLLLFSGLTTVILFIVAICRRKWIGCINVLLVLLTFITTCALICPESPTYESMLGLLDGSLANPLVQTTYAFTLCLFTLNLVLGICRLNAKRAYGLDVARYTLAVIAAVSVIVCSIFQNSDGTLAIFTETPAFTAFLLLATMAGSVLSIANLILVVVRRKLTRKKRDAARPTADRSYAESYSNAPVVVLQMPQGVTPYPATATPIPTSSASDLKAFEQQMEVLAKEEPAAATSRAGHTYPLPIVPRVVPSADAHPDKFYESLTLEEQREFQDLFLCKTHGDFGLPEYEIGGDNTPFFKRVFAALGKYREIISDGLLEKIYDEVR